MCARLIQLKVSLSGEMVVVVVDSRGRGISNDHVLSLINIFLVTANRLLGSADNIRTGVCWSRGYIAPLGDSAL